MNWTTTGTGKPKNPTYNTLSRAQNIAVRVSEKANISPGDLEFSCRISPVIFPQSLIVIILPPFAKGEQTAERRDLPSSGCDCFKRAKIHQTDSVAAT